MGRVFSGRDVVNWKVVANDGEVKKYPETFPESKKRGRPMNDLNGFKAAHKLAQQYGGFAVRA